MLVLNAPVNITMCVQCYMLTLLQTSQCMLDAVAWCTCKHYKVIRLCHNSDIVKTLWCCRSYLNPGIPEKIALVIKAIPGSHYNFLTWTPCLSASLAIACQMGKGPYFACQIRQNELYFLKNLHLPPHKLFAQHGHHTLFNNETILHNVRIYLTSQALDTVSPRILCQHVNNIILPALRIKGMITETTACWWLKSKLGYECKIFKKGMYMDGHKHSDVIKERKEFVDQIFDKYKQWVGHIQCPDHPMILIYYW